MDNFQQSTEFILSFYSRADYDKTVIKICSYKIYYITGRYV